MTARELSLRALIQFRRYGAWPDLFLKQEGAKQSLPREELGLATALTYGTLQNLALLDFYLSAYSSMPLRKLMPQVLDAMRIGAYQLVFFDRVPHSAAVNETVSLVKKHANPRAAGFANAVLRKLAANLDALPEPQGEACERLSVRYSHPLWFVQRMHAVLGEEKTELLLRANNENPPAVLRVNTLKADAGQAMEMLEHDGIETELHPYLPDALIARSLAGLGESEALRSGVAAVQDAASQLCVHALAPQSGEFALDMCAAPGGKTVLAAQLMGNRGTIIACDIHPHKADLIEKNAGRCGVEIVQTVCADASKPRDVLFGRADAIICDVPCSGMGIIRKKPDVRFKKEEELAALPALQYSILDTAARYLKPGGRLVYSTCTVLPEENEQVVQAFLERNPRFSLEPFALPGIGQTCGMKTLYPHRDGTDGFFMARLKNSEET
ncbi:MAG: 16S rRNA (cytosine(967)-C(5))-methyltransferase [Clostridium sp. SCN 57-10]|nr:MAG: 16S rRNA (cytosine(967)-C(5))-methyltransferase [Clostridium sp. SCN 57-10]